MLSTYRISANNTKKRSKKALNTGFDNNSHHGPDDKRPQMTQMTSKNLNRHQMKIVRKQKQKTIYKVDLYKRILKLTNTI